MGQRRNLFSVKVIDLLIDWQIKWLNRRHHAMDKLRDVRQATRKNRFMEDMVPRNLSQQDFDHGTPIGRKTGKAAARPLDIDGPKLMTLHGHPRLLSIGHDLDSNSNASQQLKKWQKVFCAHIV